MICCPARSGSTLLVHLLRSHPEILSHGEVLGQKITGLSGPLGARSSKDPDVLKALEEIRQARSQVYLYSYILHPHGKMTVGFKLKYEELGSPEYAGILDFIKADTDLKIIFLDRENLFERYVSHYVVVNVTGVTLVQSHQPRPEVRPIMLDPADIERNFKEELDKRQRFRALFSAHRSIETTYDKLVADTVPEMNRIYRFLDLGEHVAATTTKKVLDTQPASFIKNYAEILEYFSKTQYASYFADTSGTR
jgi:LPS sulfotransferase NodH